ncbi:MAG: hypothetical protein IH962_06280 [Chloroflexi bacterium]|nr:hypothetical protein [Chloroflexota bacterium]
MRAKALGMTDHPVVVIDHPIASKGKEQILRMAQDSADEVARGLMSADGQAKSG